MEAYRNTIIFGCVAAYMVLCIVIGLWAMRKTKTAHDFFMAGRNLGVLVTGIAVFSSTLSGFGFVGGPALIYKMGISSVFPFTCSANESGYLLPCGTQSPCRMLSLRVTRAS